LARAVVVERLERVPRPDVAHAVPGIGDASRAGYVLTAA